MLISYYNWCHSIGLHFYTIPLIVLLVIMVIVGLVHWRNQNKREDDFEDELQDKIEEIQKTRIGAVDLATKEGE